MDRRGLLLGLFASLVSLTPAAAEALSRSASGLGHDDSAEFGSQFGFFLGRVLGGGRGRRRFPRGGGFRSRRFRAARRPAPGSSGAPAAAAPPRGQSGGS